MEKRDRVPKAKLSIKAGSQRSFTYSEEMREFANAILESLGEINEKDNLIAKHMKCELADLDTLSYTFPSYMINQGMYALSTFLSESCKDVGVYNFDGYGKRESPVHKSVEVSPDKYLRMVEQGYILFHYSKVPMMISCYIQESGFYIYISGPPVYEHQLNTALQEIANISQSRSLYKNKAVEVEARKELKFVKGTPKVTWDDIIVSDDIKREIDRQLINVANDASYHEKYHLPWRRGMLLEGLPGTGKTMIGKLLLNSVKVTYMLVSSKAIYDAYDIKVMFEAARRFAPTLIFFEDIDLFGYERSAGSSTVLGELLTQMDGVKDSEGIFVVGTTNRKDALDKALSNRPNRFDTIINFGLPSIEERIKILELYNKKYQCNCRIEDLKSVANRHEIRDFTPAYLSELLIYAKILAMDGRPESERSSVSVTLDHLHKSMMKVTDNVKKQKEMYG